MKPSENGVALVATLPMVARSGKSWPRDVLAHNCALRGLLNQPMPITIAYRQKANAIYIPHHRGGMRWAKSQSRAVAGMERRMSTLHGASDWLAGTSLSLAIANHNWTVPMLQSVHILAIGIVMASIGMLDLRLAGFLGREQSMRGLTLRFYPWIWGALAVLLATGLLQIMAEPARELLNWVFWTKMALIVGAALFTAPVRLMLEDCRYRDLAPGKRSIIRICALTSLVLWVAVLTCGRWIAYAGGQV